MENNPKGKKLYVKAEMKVFMMATSEIIATSGQYSEFSVEQDNWYEFEY